MNAATRAFIERLVDRLERAEATMADVGNMVGHKCQPSTALIAEARKLLEGDALTQPASEDAWLKQAKELLSKAMFASAARVDWVLSGDAVMEHLRTRPAREGFVSVPVEPTEAMISIGTHANSEWLNDNAPIGERLYRDPAIAVYKGMIAAAKGDGK